MIRLNANRLSWYIAGTRLTKRQAERMVDVLRDAGYDVKYGKPASTRPEIERDIDYVDFLTAWDQVYIETLEGEL